jgi:malonate-semialdehyde dehydrogenase (acetylating)/methylmalonate-semialdehyde dehydrogenase
MVGINVAYRAVGVFSFTGPRTASSATALPGQDSYRFFTEQKTVTTHWFDEHERINGRFHWGTI